MQSSDNASLHVAVVESDALLRERVLLPRMLEYGFTVTGLGSRAELDLLLAQRLPDIVVLQIGLPDADGFSVARMLRRTCPGLGVVLLTGRQDRADQVRGLVEGADAYLIKPVDAGLLAATLHSLGRRLQAARATPPARPPQAGPWQLQSGGWRLQAPCGHAVALSRSERPVVQRLLRQPGEVVRRDQLIAELTDNVFEFDTHRLDSLIHRLRRKVSTHCAQALPLNAVHGQGYVFTP